MKPKSLAILSFSFIIIILFALRYQIPYAHVLSWDTFGYYLYLPARFIYNDLAIHHKEWIDQVFLQYHPSASFYQAHYLENGNWVFNYTVGWALLLAPFFFLAHYLAPLLGYAPDGFSAPYQFCISWACFLYGLLGLLAFYRWLLRFFPVRLSLLILLLILLGSNYFQSLTISVDFQHNLLFGLYTLFLLSCDNWHKKPAVKSAVSMGLLAGLITLLRPCELLIVIIPSLWGIHNIQSLREKIHLVLSRYKTHIVLAALAFLLCCSIQMFYWKSISGQFVFNSYRGAQVGFDFGSPHTIPFLFSFRKGWFIYTPLVIFAFLGFYYLHHQRKNLFAAFAAFLLINLYVVSSWSCWWYAAGSFSSRSMIPVYSLLALPLGFLLQRILQLSRGWKISALLLAVFLCTLNLFQHWQFYHGILDGERMTAAYYRNVFGKTRVNEEDKKLLLVERPVTAGEKMEEDGSCTLKRVILENFEQAYANDPRLSSKRAHSGRFSIQLDSAHIFSPDLRRSFAELTGHYYAWVRISAWVYIADSLHDEAPLLSAAFHHKHEPYKYYTSENMSHTVKKGRWHKISFDYMTPEVRNTHDYLKVYFWYRGRKPVFIDDLQMEVFEPQQKNL